MTDDQADENALSLAITYLDLAHGDSDLKINQVIEHLGMMLDKLRGDCFDEMGDLHKAALKPGATMTRLEGFAIQVATIVPEKSPDHHILVQVPLWLIRDLRQEMERLGYDWRAGCKAYRRNLKAAEAKRRAA